MESITNGILRLKNAIDDNNIHRPEVKNELVVTALLNPPKVVWFSDSGSPPAGHRNRLQEILDINKWIVEFNTGYHMSTPRFHRYGVKHGRYFRNGEVIPYTIHQLSQLQQADTFADRLLLTDYWRIKLRQAAVAKGRFQK